MYGIFNYLICYHKEFTIHVGKCTVRPMNPMGENLHHVLDLLDSDDIMRALWRIFFSKPSFLVGGFNPFEKC